MKGRAKWDPRDVSLVSGRPAVSLMPANTSNESLYVIFDTPGTCVWVYNESIKVEKMDPFCKIYKSFNSIVLITTGIIL